MSDDNDSSGEQQLEPTAKEGKSDEIFEVEKILDHDVTDNKKIFFQVRWAGYDESEDTWEPEEDLQECAKKVIKEYYKKMGVQNKAELIKKETRKTPNKKKSTPNKPAKRERSPSPVSEEDESDDDSDASDSPVAKTPSKKKRRSDKPSTSAATTKPKVQTKAALKAYGESSPTKASAKSSAVTSLPKQKAQGLRQMMWASSDDDDEDERPDISEIDKIASKVKPNAAQTPAKTEAPSIKTEDPSPSPVRVEPPISGDESIPSSSATPREEWTINGIAKSTTNGSSEKLVLVTNTASGERQVLNAEDAFKLCGWTLTKYLLRQCEF